MRILHTIASVNPSGGGPIEGIKQIGRVNTSHGHQVEVASLDPPEAEFLKAVALPVHALGSRTSKYGYSKRYVPWLKENAAKYDVVVVNGIWQYNSFGTWRALRRSTTTPYVVFTHGMLDPWFKRTYPLKHLKKWLYWPWGEYRVLRDAAAVIFTCEEERLLARQSFWLYCANERVTAYGAKSPTGNPEAERNEFLKNFPRLRDKRVILFLGRIHPKKGCDIAIQSFAATLASDPAWQLVIAGPNQTGWQSSLERLAAKLGISDRITWPGMITGSLKIGALRSADALFLPSHQENFGIVVAEALSCSLPVLISDKVNIWREIEEDSAGFVAPDTAAGASHLLDTWSKLTNNQQNTMRQRARQSFENRFEIEKASSALTAILAKAIADKQLTNKGPAPTPVTKLRIE